MVSFVVPISPGGLPRSVFLAATCLLALPAAVHSQTAHFSGAQSTVPTSKLNNPDGVAVDSGGTVYIDDTHNSRILKETLSGGTYIESSIADYASSYLYIPEGVAVDSLDNVYVSDTGNDQVLKETLLEGSYVPTTIAGPQNGLDFPFGTAVDIAGNVYIADYFNNRILKETLSGGTYIQSTVPTSTLAYPFAVAVDNLGNLYISDTYDHRVLKETLSAGGYSESTLADLTSYGGGRSPFGIAADARGNIYFSALSDLSNYVDDKNDDVFKETPSNGGYIQSTVVSSGEQNPHGVAVNARGDLYLADTDNNRIEKLQSAAADFGQVNVGATSLTISLIFTLDTAGKLGSPAVLTGGMAGLDFADAGTGSCTTNGASYTYAAGDVCTIDVTLKPQFSGIRYGAAILKDGLGNTLATGYMYGAGLAPQVSFLPGTKIPIDSALINPSGVAVDAAGNVFFAEAGSGAVYKEALSGGAYSRTPIAVGLTHPTAVALDGGGNVYIADSDVVYKETPSHGSYRQSEIVTDLDGLDGVAVDGRGNLYITASSTGDVHKETLQANGAYAEKAIGSGITGPSGVAVDGLGNIYIADARQGEVYKQTLQADGSYVQTVLAGGIADPEGVAADGNGNLYIAAPATGTVYKETLQPSGAYVQTLVAGGLTEPWGIAVDARGNLYLSQDTARGDLLMVDLADPPSLTFVRTRLESISTDSPQSIMVTNIGNAGLTFPVPATGTNPTIAASFALAGVTTCPEVAASGVAASVAAGKSCVYAINFIPVNGGSINGSLALTDTNLNLTLPGDATQNIALSGTGIAPDKTRTAVNVSPNPVAAGGLVTVTVTVRDTTHSATVPKGGVTFSDTVGNRTVPLNRGAAVTLSDGTATLSIAPAIAGTHTVTARYLGVSGSFAVSSGEASLTVRRPR